MPIVSSVNIVGSGIQGTTGSQGAQGPIGATGAINFQGIHNNWRLGTANTLWITNNMTGGNMSNGAITANRMLFMCFVPAKNTVYSELWMNVTAGVAGALSRILIYDDLEGRPNRKLYESTNLDCSTTGRKVVTTSGTFLAGTPYWLCVHSSVGITATVMTSSFSYVMRYVPVGNSYQFVHSYSYNATFASAPDTLIFSQINYVTSFTPLIGISMG